MAVVATVAAATTGAAAQAATLGRWLLRTRTRNLRGA